VTNLGTFGGLVNDPSAVNGGALAINNNGEVAGFTRNATNTNYTAFTWTQSGGLKDIGVNASFAEALNNKGQVVGYIQPSGTNQNFNGFIYDPKSGFVDLNDDLVSNSGWTNTLAMGINDNGQIVGYGDYNNSEQAFIANPVLAPEPPSYLLFPLGIFIVYWFRFRKHSLSFT
jgi:probable HAF family extracellular repeat protein